MLILLGVGFSISFCPKFSICILVIFGVSFGFILTEGMFTHDANEFENRFWSSIAFFFACACTLVADSPFRFRGGQGVLAFPVICGFTYLVHIYDRHLRRAVLNKVPNMMRRIRSADFTKDFNRLSAHQNLNLLREYLETIDMKWVSSTFTNIFLLPRVLNVEHEIIKIFTEVPQIELNYILENIQLGRIFYKVKDHRMARRFNRTKILELLAVRRVKELNPVAKAMLLHGLQVMKLSAHPKSEFFVKNIIFSAKDDELSELKSLTDTKGDVNSMHKLLYVDIRDKEIKEDILSYIKKQASVQAGHNLIGSKKGKRRGKFAWRKILSDVDDTLVSSGGSWPAGLDTSYPKKVRNRSNSLIG